MNSPDSYPITYLLGAGMVADIIAVGANVLGVVGIGFIAWAVILWELEKRKQAKEPIRREGPAESMEEFWNRVCPPQYCEVPCPLCGTWEDEWEFS